MIILPDDLFRPASILAAILVSCVGFTIGPTYLPCYATLCSEEFFGLQICLHIMIFYSLLATIEMAELWMCNSLLSTVSLQVDA
jgi:hypothetical protein